MKGPLGPGPRERDYRRQACHGRLEPNRACPSGNTNSCVRAQHRGQAFHAGALLMRAGVRVAVFSHHEPLAARWAERPAALPRHRRTGSRAGPPQWGPPAATRLTAGNTRAHQAATSRRHFGQMLCLRGSGSLASSERATPSRLGAKHTQLDLIDHQIGQVHQVVQLGIRETRPRAPIDDA